MRQIELSQGLFTVVDNDDYEELSKYKWSAAFDPTQNCFYAIRKDYTINKTLRIHRVIMKTPAHLQVDHINHDTLDNRKINLRNVTNSQNMMNTRKRNNSNRIYKGVSYRFSDNRKKHYQARIAIDGVRIGLGYYSSEIEAAQAYDKKAIELFGEHAFLNFPVEK